MGDSRSTAVTLIHVRCGSVASFEPSGGDFRYCSERRHLLALQQVTQRARNRLLHRNKFGEVQRSNLAYCSRTEALRGRFRLSGVQLVEQRLSPLQIESVETFGEAAVDGG